MSESEKTNVIFILTDDQGPWALGCAGNPEIRTPSLDRLAARGVRFTDFFCTSPVCSPSRASLMTGRIPSQHGVHDWIRGGSLPPDAIGYLDGLKCYPEVLAEHGWQCGLSGKWHLGDSLRTQAGFGHWFAHQGGGGKYNDAPMVRDGECIAAPGYVTDVITDDALEFLGENAARPFYLSVHYTAPHSPWTGHPQDIVDSYDDCAFDSCPQEPRHPWARGLTDSCLGDREMLKGYFAAVTAMDANVGRIMDRVEELGLAEKTLIVFTSDNGFSCGHHGFWGKGNGTNPLNMYENSVKVPLIASHPGRISEGVVSDAMASGYDVMPTLIDYLGLPPLVDERLPGSSFAPVLLGAKQDGHDEVVVFDEYGPVRMIRTRGWKYIERHADGHGGGAGETELYDLGSDPDERENLAAEGSHSGRVREMQDRLREWFGRYVDPGRDGWQQPVDGAGQMKMTSVPPDASGFFTSE